MNNVYVARSVEHNGLESYFNNKKEHQAIAKRIIDFHWFSVNKDLPDEFFDGSKLGEKDQVMELVDTELSKAETLLPQTAKK